MAICVSVKGLPPPEKPRTPAGLIDTVLPTELSTELIFWPTAWWATNIASDKPIIRPSIRTIEKVRIVFRKAFRIPLVTTFINIPFL